MSDVSTETIILLLSLSLVAFVINMRGGDLWVVIPSYVVMIGALLLAALAVILRVL